MKKLVFLLVSTFLCSISLNAQTRGVKIGYIDMEYILEKVPDYANAKNQLEEKAQKWKQEIEVQKLDVAKLKEALKTEKVLLTKELIEEREEEIAFQEKEMLDYQQKRFGPTGDLVTQKLVLVKPIQDQVFTAVQDYADAKKYDYIFDKSSDLTILFAAKRYDISDRIVSTLGRSEKRNQLSKKQLQAEKDKEAREDMILDNPDLLEREKALEDRKVARQKLLDDRKAAADAKREAALLKRQQLIDERNAKKNGTVSDTTESSTSDDNTSDGVTAKEKAVSDREQKVLEAAEARKNTLEERKKALEDRKAAAEARRLQILADREAAKKAREEEIKNKNTNP
jgi:Skp family chaperone for outer membrane proteins